ncbi:hypothetical protein TNCV_1626591 [Trichonephila clavipes]|nr:hypothetical protein TNCV_1626591 [Trichonephila clavipes]
MLLWLLRIPPIRLGQIEAHKVHRVKRLDIRMMLVVALCTIQVTIWFGSAPVSTLEAVKGLSPLFPIHQPHKRACGSTAI